MVMIISWPLHTNIPSLLSATIVSHDSKLRLRDTEYTMGVSSVSLHSYQAVKELALRTETWISLRTMDKQSIQQKQ